MIILRTVSDELGFCFPPTTNRIPSPIYRVLVRMNFPLRFRRAAIAATIFLIALSIITPAIAAADTGNPVPTITMPDNDTSLASIAAYDGTIAPQSSFEKLGNQEITLFRFESNQTTFPGPRSMAFGPRYIQLTTNIGALLLISAAACIVVLAFVIYRRRKAGATEADTSENTPENSDEKQG
ncbi:MAG: hypothetical protein NTW33_09820 [Methanoregula sp.]|nr:hypothetical protein [Methanoregula sp.]